MNILVGMECSGRVRDAFLAKGHNAVSCDLKRCETGNPSRHFRCDVYEAMEYPTPWDIIIIHPDCTKLAVSGNRWYGRGTSGMLDRKKAREWTVELWRAVKEAARVGACLENPVGVLSRVIGKPQYIQPWQFGHGETKKTGLWLDRLPELIPTDIVPGREQRVWRMAPGDTRKADRARTYLGIAEAMADQWTNWNRKVK